jgi:hypothetical protein
MISLEEMPVVLTGDGMTVRCSESDGGKYWAITRTPEASVEAIARALEGVPNPTGFRMDFPINGEFTYEFYCAN